MSNVLDYKWTLKFFMHAVEMQTLRSCIIKTVKIFLGKLSFLCCDGKCCQIEISYLKWKRNIQKVWSFDVKLFRFKLFFRGKTVFEV
jgi:hypothetical protein